MSGEDITAVLLPLSSVDVFLFDEGTSNLIDKLRVDWRFSRVKITSDKMGIEDAVKRYEEVPSPELIIIETNDIGEGFIEQLESLAGVCSEGTDAIIIGPSNDVHIYRNLVEMGVKDYLVRPVEEEEMLKVIARALIEKRGFSGSRLISVIGSKGGVGATSIAQLLAWNISEDLKQKTMLMDLAGSLGNIGVAYGLEPTATLIEAVRLGEIGSEEDMTRIYQKVSDNLSVLACGSESVFSDIPHPDNVEILLKRIMQKYPVVVVDISWSSRAVQKRVIELSSKTVVVAAPLISALRNARAIVNELKSLKMSLDDVNLIINMKNMASSEEVPMADIKSAIALEPAVVVDYMPKVFLTSETEGKPAGQNSAAKKILDDLIPLCEKASAVKSKSIKESSKDKSFTAFINNLVGRG